MFIRHLIKGKNIYKYLVSEPKADLFGYRALMRVLLRTVWSHFISLFKKSEVVTFFPLRAVCQTHLTIS